MAYIDLTMPINERTPVYPGDPSADFRRIAFCEKDGWNGHRVSMNTHFGTHIDAPWHMLDDGKKLTEYSIDHFIGRAVLLDVRGRQQIEASLVTIECDDIVLLRTDHTKTYECLVSLPTTLLSQWSSRRS